MKYVVIGSIVILMLLGFWWLRSREAAVVQPLGSIQAAMNEGAVLVDVRTAEEFGAEHAVGAVNVSLQQIQAGDYGNLPKDETIYVYCRSGNRSAQAKKILEGEGYDVVDLKSLTAWKQMGGQAEPCETC